MVKDMNNGKLIYRKITKYEFDKLKHLFPDNNQMWIKYKNKRLQQFEMNDIDVYVIEDNGSFVGEVSVNYSNHTLKTETISGKRVYLEAFRLNKDYQGFGLGQELIKFVVNDLENIGYTEFTIGVEDDNEIAKHIYFKYGFVYAIDKGHGDEFDPCDYTLYMRKSNKK